MTFEPGQQVLVRGIIGVVRDREVLVRFTDRVGVKFGVHFAAADVVGPAPATPDEGVSSDPWAEPHELRDALVAAEAERDAYFAAARVLYRYWDLEWHSYPTNDLHAVAVESFFAADPEIRRALSVEATGTEGGGGHE